MPVTVFGNSFSSYDNGHKIDTSLFVQKPYLRSNYIESKIEEDIDLKIQNRIKNLPDPVSIREAAPKNHVDNKFNVSRLIENTAHVDFKDKKLNNVRSIKVNSFPTLEQHLTPKIYVDQAISNGVNESSFLRLDSDEKLKLDERGSILVNSTLTSPRTIIEIPTKKNVE